MNNVGTVSLEQLGEMKRRGMTPQGALSALQKEAAARWPDCTILVLKSQSHAGFDIVAVA